MKNLLLFVCLVLLGTTASAQQFFMPQGTTNNVYPFGSNQFNKVQWLYLPTDFTVPLPTGNITKLYFKTWNGAASYTASYSNFSIRMANTALTTFPSPTYITPTTLVFTGNPVIVASTPQFTWFSFTLQTPFTYTGQNFILDIEQNNIMAGSITVNCKLTGANRRIYGSYGATAGNLSSDIGDLGLDMCDACDSPINIVKNNLGRFNVNLSWDPINCASGYEYLIDKTPANPTSWGYATVAAPALSLTGLEDGTCYYIHLKTQCGGPSDTSGWSLDSFCTVQDCKTPIVTIEDITGTTAIARWDAVPGAVSYEYSVGTTPDTPVQGHKTTYTNVKLLGLTPNKPLYFYLKARCGATPQSPWGVTPFHTEAGTAIDDVVMAGDITVSAFPNPAKDMVTVQVDGNTKGNATVRLTDIAGRVIATQSVQGNRCTFATGNLAPGLYYLQYTDEVYKQTIKVNKQ